MTGFLQNRNALEKAGRLGKLPPRLHSLCDGEDVLSGYLDALAIHLTVQGLLLDQPLDVRPASVGFAVSLLHGGGRLQLWLHLGEQESPWGKMSLEALLGSDCLAHAEVELQGIRTQLDVRSAFHDIPHGVHWERLSDTERAYYQAGLDRTYSIVLAQAAECGLEEPEKMLAAAYPQLLCDESGEIVHWQDGTPICVYTPLPCEVTP
jgi:hypothetical protein